MSDFLHKCNGNCTLFMVLLITILCLLLYKCYNKTYTKEKFALTTQQINQEQIIKIQQLANINLSQDNTNNLIIALKSIKMNKLLEPQINSLLNGIQLILVQKNNLSRELLVTLLTTLQSIPKTNKFESQINLLIQNIL